MARLFGEIEGYPEGTLFDSREALNKAGVHRPTMGGISGTAEAGADSIVLSGGYEDDVDYGDEIVYTGHGDVTPTMVSRSQTKSLHAVMRAWLGTRHQGCLSE